MSVYSGRRVHYCCFRSTDVEQQNYRRLLWSVPDEMLLFLALGKEVVVLDGSVKGKGKVERIWIPVLRDILRFHWRRAEPREKRLKPSFSAAYSVLLDDTQLRTRFDYYGEIADKYRSEIRLEARTMRIERERAATEYLQGGEVHGSPSKRGRGTKEGSGKGGYGVGSGER